MAANMYRVGDYVYFETSSTAPFQIRRIEELNKTASGNVEAKVMCFYRRRDISSALVGLADKHHSVLDDDDDDDDDDDEDDDTKRKEQLSEEEKHLLKHRELFLSRQVETLPATHIRGKCSVTLLNETEELSTYLSKDDMFFYSLVYDPSQKTLLADRGEIRVGSKYQAEVPKTPLEDPPAQDERDSKELETLVWNPENGVADAEIDKFMVVARSVGTFARALDCTSTVRQPSLHMSAAAASRDITLFHAMDTLHDSGYSVSDALSLLVPENGPVLCRDEMEEWSASEANLFEEALDKYGKDFNDIRQDYLPWKTLKSIVEYYYMWKTTDRYVQQKRIKAAEAESKLKQVYIPAYNKPNPAALLSGNKPGEGPYGGRQCESCSTLQATQWYSWGAAHTGTRLCSSCWNYWKRFGGLISCSRPDGSGNFAESERPHPEQRQERVAQMQQQMRLHRCHIAQCGKEFRAKNHLARHLTTVHGLMLRSGSPRPVMKTRAAFCLVTTALTRLSRRLCRDLLMPRSTARNPFKPVNVAAIKQQCQLRLDSGKKVTVTKRKAPPVGNVLKNLGVDVTLQIDLLKPSNRAPAAFIKYPKSKEPAPLPSELRGAVGPSIMKKRAYENPGDVSGPPSKRPYGAMRQAGGHLPADRRRLQNGVPMKPSYASWQESPDDLLYLANTAYRQQRQTLGNKALKRAARKPAFLLPTSKPAAADTGEVVVLD